MLRERSLSLIVNMVLKGYIEQEELISYEDYLIKFEKFISNKFSTQDQDIIKNYIISRFKTNLEELEKIKNIEINNTILSNLNTYITKLNNKLNIKKYNKLPDVIYSESGEFMIEYIISDLKNAVKDKNNYKEILLQIHKYKLPEIKDILKDMEENIDNEDLRNLYNLNFLFKDGLKRKLIQSRSKSIKFGF